MSRCEGSTKAGERCKRSAFEGGRFCSTHAPKSSSGKEKASKAAESAPRDENDSCDSENAVRDVFDAVFGLAAAGVVIVAAMTLRRFIRIF